MCASPRHPPFLQDYAEGLAGVLEALDDEAAPSYAATILEVDPSPYCLSCVFLSVARRLVSPRCPKVGCTPRQGNPIPNPALSSPGAEKRHALEGIGRQRQKVGAIRASIN